MGYWKLPCQATFKSTHTCKRTYRAYTNTHTHTRIPPNTHTFAHLPVSQTGFECKHSQSWSVWQLQQLQQNLITMNAREREREPRDNENSQSCADNAKRAFVSRGEPRSGADARNLVCENQSFLLVVASNESVSIKPREPALKCLRVCQCVCVSRQ